MNLDLKSAAIGLALGLVAWGGWYAGSTRPVIQKLVEEKAQAIGRANQAEQESAKYKGLAEHWFEVANSQPQQVPQDPSVTMLNAVRPGLGTVASQIGKVIQQHQATQVASVTPAQPVVLPKIWSDEGSKHGCAQNQIFLSETGCLSCNPTLHPGIDQYGNWGCVQ